MDKTVFVVEVRGIDRSLYRTEVEAISKAEALKQAIKEFTAAGLGKQMPNNPLAWSRIYPK